MPPPLLVSPVTGDPIPEFYIHSDSINFRDNFGRSILLRGINLSASAKQPINQPGSKLEGFWENAKSGEMSFVGRVLDLEDGKVDQHLERLKGWGFNCLRYIVNWESIEHAGPGQYDRDYIEYTVKLLRKIKEHGFLVYMDPHQDLFSRFSGGSGAPYWSLIACGLEPENFTVTNAACIECEWPTGSQNFPAMIWASNYSRLACQTLFTLWNAGRDYAPKCIIDGVNIQDYLQSHYFNAMTELGNAIRDAGDLLDVCVIGWDSLNEPHHGYLGVESLSEHGKDVVLKLGPMPTSVQAMILGMGGAVEVEKWKFSSTGPKRDGNIIIDPSGKKAWLSPDAEVSGSKWGWKRDLEWKLGTCIWAMHGVWDISTGEILISDYFSKIRGSDDEGKRDLDWQVDYWLPNWDAWAVAVRKFHPEAIHFIQTPVFQIPPKIISNQVKNRAAHSSHFYDGLTLITKHWNWFNADALGILRGKYSSVLFGIKIGETAIRNCMQEQLGVLRQDSFDALGQFPTMMGEIGIPFDLDGKKAYQDGDYSGQIKAMDASLNACDGTNALNYSIWTYCPDNSHERGDQWNGEDLSLWSADDAERSYQFRNSTSQLDLSGKISKSRSRASSKASSINGTPFLTPNVSSSRLSALNPSLTTLANSTSSLTAPSIKRSLSESQTLNNDSSATLGSVNSNANPFSPINLNDGARAIAAFSRPYPMKSVGTPTLISFDIKSSKFTLEITVAADDVIDSDSPTEVYIPLIHYATFPHRISQNVKNDIEFDSSDFDQLNTSSLKLTKVEDPRSLSLDVKLSSGRFEVEGQILRWFYPRPKIGSIIVKLELSRSDGPIPAWVHALTGQESSNGFCNSVMTSICPPDCRVQ